MKYRKKGHGRIFQTTKLLRSAMNNPDWKSKHCIFMRVAGKYFNPCNNCALFFNQDIAVRCMKDVYHCFD